METQAFDTKPLLRPAQIEDAKSEIKAAEAKMQSPHIEDKAEVARQLRRLTKTLADQTPQPPVNGDEEGRMVARSRQLLSDILVGMPSQEEMRKAPPGAVDKHMAWEKRNKAKILEWKNLQLRLTHGSEPEAANLERHRPVSSTLNMDNAFIPGKQFYLPPAGAGMPVTFSDEQIAVLRVLSPDLAAMLATLSNAQRAEVKTALAGGIGLAEKSEASEKGRRHALAQAEKRKTETPEERQKHKSGKQWTAEERKAFGEKMKAARNKARGIT